MSGINQKYLQNKKEDEGKEIEIENIPVFNVKFL